VGQFFHAVGIFFHHLAAVRWDALALALACQLAKLLLRAVAWRSIVQAAYPDRRVRYWDAFGAYVAGGGVNAIIPARGGDLVKLYLIRQRVPGSSYATLAPTLIVETIFDMVVAGGLLVWALTLGVLPTHEVYARLPTVDWRLLLRHEKLTAIGLVVLAVVLVVGLLWARVRVDRFRERVGQGFAILHDRPRFLSRVILPQALSWGFRLATIYFFLRAFRVQATLHNALLAQVVESLATLFPATPGGAGTKQGLIVFLFRHQAVSRTQLLAFSVGMNIALTVVSVVLGLAAIGVMARTLSFKRLRLRAEQPTT
jgi:glycosyltransferase 2 family protein